jgi:hypothetical protein
MRPGVEDAMGPLWMKVLAATKIGTIPDAAGRIT